MVPFIDEFEDRLGIRQVIRDAYNSNDLDDAHDLEGNALYRLQFMASITPGPNHRQFGVASLRVEPPALDDNDLRILYSTWLAHITHRLNPDPDKARGAHVPMSYEALGAITGLYDVAVVLLRTPKWPRLPFCRSIAIRSSSSSQNPSGRLCTRLPWLLDHLKGPVGRHSDQKNSRGSSTVAGRL
ncbi:MAG: hypothetical protein QM777_10145 [Pseudorhodoferax sp.]